MLNKFIAWLNLLFVADNEFMPDEEWKAEHERINEDHNIIYKPLAEAMKNEDES